MILGCNNDILNFSEASGVSHHKEVVYLILLLIQSMRNSLILGSFAVFLISFPQKVCKY